MHKIPRNHNIYYLYKHISLDSNEIFYIGVGVKRKFYSNTFESKYERAHNCNGRSSFWKNYVNKHGRKVEIIFEIDDRDLILNKEKEFIKLYGRRDLCLGRLVNLTDGGELPIFLNKNSELKRRNKISEALKKRVRKLETFIKISQSKYKRIIRSDNKEFISLTEAAKEMNISIAAISKSLKNDKYTTKGYRWKYKSI